MYNACSAEKLATVLKYIISKREGDFIEDPKNGWRKQYLSFKSVSQNELDTICQIVHDFILQPDEEIGNSMGELFFSTKGDINNG